MIDEFEFAAQEPSFDPLGVMLFKALQVIAFLFFIALLAIKTRDDEGKIDPKLEFLITVSWPDKHPDDIDMFVQDPIGNMVWYRRRESGFMVLDRDDRGGLNDFILVNGQKVPSPIRQEIVSIRGIVAGEYTVDIYHFAALSGQPVPVTVKVEKLNPKVQVVYYDTIALDHGGMEKTAVRFAMDKAGAVVDVNRDDKSLVQTLNKRNRERKG